MILFFAYLCSDIENDSVYDAGLGHDLAINLFLARHHLQANLVDQDLVVGREVLIDVILKTIKFDIVSEVT